MLKREKVIPDLCNTQCIETVCTYMQVFRGSNRRVYSSHFLTLPNVGPRRRASPQSRKMRSLFFSLSVLYVCMYMSPLQFSGPPHLFVLQINLVVQYELLALVASISSLPINSIVHLISHGINGEYMQSDLISPINDTNIFHERKIHFKLFLIR